VIVLVEHTLIAVRRTERGMCWDRKTHRPAPLARTPDISRQKLADRAQVEGVRTDLGYANLGRLRRSRSIERPRSNAWFSSATFQSGLRPYPAKASLGTLYRLAGCWGSGPSASSGLVTSCSTRRARARHAPRVFRTQAPGSCTSRSASSLRLRAGGSTRARRGAHRRATRPSACRVQTPKVQAPKARFR